MFRQSFPDPDIVGDLTVDGDVDLNSGLQVYGDVTFEEGVDFEKGAEFKGGVGISTGAASGYVLTSDATGGASWQANAVSYPFTTDFLGSTERTQNLTSITGTSGFKNQSTLDDIYIGSNVTSIGSYSFQYSGNFNITIASGLTTIANYGCGGSYISGSLKLPNSVTTIGDYAFIYSTLTSITLPTNASFTTIPSSAFQYCGLTSITIPSNVTSIGGYAFASGGLTSLTIPSTVTTIGSGAFRYNASLTTITCLRMTPPTVVSGAVGYVNTTEIHVPTLATGYGTTLDGLTVVKDL